MNFLLYPTNGTEQKDTDKDGKQTHKRGHKQDLSCQLVVALHVFGHDIAADRRRRTEEDENNAEIYRTEAEQVSDQKRGNGKDHRFANRRGQRVFQLTLQRREGKARAKTDQRQSKGGVG